MSGNFAIKGGGGGGPLMANAILNFHFDFLHTSLSPKRQKSNYLTNYLAFFLALLGVVWSKNLPQSHNLRIYQSVPKVANCFCVYNMLIDFE